MSTPNLKRKSDALTLAVRQFQPYEPVLKDNLHRAARAFLKAFATEVLELPADAYDLRTNKAGIAVSGEITLHSDDTYIQISEPFSGGKPILARECKGRKDYTGLRNIYLEPHELIRVGKDWKHQLTSWH